MAEVLGMSVKVKITNLLQRNNLFRILVILEIQIIREFIGRFINNITFGYISATYLM